MSTILLRISSVHGSWGTSLSLGHKPIPGPQTYPWATNLSLGHNPVPWSQNYLEGADLHRTPNACWLSSQSFNQHLFYLSPAEPA
jgi:hypothetical protein